MGGSAPRVDGPVPRRPRLRFALVAAAAVLLVGSGIAAARLAGGGTRPPAATGQDLGIAVARVGQGTLSAQQQVSGTVGYQGSYTIEDQLPGVYTDLPVAGQVIRSGEALYSVGTGSSATEAALLSAEAQFAADQASLQEALNPTAASRPALEADEQRVAADQQNIANTPEEIALQQARITADQQKIATDQQNIKHLSVTSPVAGTISSVAVSSGQQVGMGATLFQVVQPDSIEVQTSVPEIDLPNIYVGEGVQVWTQDQGTMNAAVSAIGVTSNGSNRQGALFPVTLTVENPPSGMRAGMQATVNFTQAYLTEAGIVAFADTRTVTAQVSGMVTGVAAQAGQSVQAGQSLITLSNPGFETQLTQDETALTSDEAQLATLQAQVTSSKAQLSSDQASLDALQHPTPPSSDQVAALRARVAADEASVQQAQANLAQGDTPVVLFYGQIPAYRDLKQGESGPDVRELNAALAADGYLPPVQVGSTFGPATTAAVRRLQAHLGGPETGVLTLGAVVFLPTAVRVTTVTPTLGAAAGSGQAVLGASSDTPQVVAQIDPSLQSDVKTGQAVTITLPDQSTVRGKVTSVGEAATTGGSSQSPSIQVDITPSHPAALSLLDGASVSVAVTTASVQDALYVPVTALLAERGGKYDIELVQPNGKRRFVPVRLGMFDDADGLVQVSGQGIVPGEEVVVAGS